MDFLNRIIWASKKYPQLNAFCIDNKYYTYAALTAKIISIREVLSERIKTQHNIGVIVNNTIETYASILAILLSGKAYVPISPDYPLQRVEQIISQASINTILSPLTDNVSYGVGILNTAGLQSSLEKTELDMPQFFPGERLAYILFTSGSTGIPKGVPLSFNSLNAFTDAFISNGYDISEQDRFLQMFDLTFDLSIMSFLIPLCIGACVYTIPDTGMKYANVYNVLDIHQISFALMVPSILSYLQPYFHEIHLPELRYSLFCGEALYNDVVEEWGKCAPNATMENVYGPTEATIFCLIYPINCQSPVAGYNGIVAIGKPMQGVEAILVDESGKETVEGKQGELCLSGRQVTSGYLNGNNAAFFEYNDNKFYRTGDLALKDNDGNFLFCGRKDTQVKVDGYRIELSEIEYHLRKITGNSNAVALVVKTGNDMQRIDAVLEGDKRSNDEIISELQKVLPAFMIPSQIHYLSSFPLNVNGKTDRNQLLKTIMAAT